MESLWDYLTCELKVDLDLARQALLKDYAEGATKRSIPAFLENRDSANPGREIGPSENKKGRALSALPKRQRNHQDSVVH